MPEKDTNLQFLVQSLKEELVSITAIVDELQKAVTADTPVKEKAPTEKPITFEEVRAVLAEKSRAGFTPEIKALIGKYGANKLSEVPKENYQALLKDVEVLGNAK